MRHLLSIYRNRAVRLFAGRRLPRSPKQGQEIGPGATDIPADADVAPQHIPRKQLWIGCIKRRGLGTAPGKQKTTLGETTMKKTVIALTMMCAAGLTISMLDLHAAAEAGKKVTPPTQELLIKGKKPVLFSHAKHAAVGLDCATCHHDAKHQPLNEAAIGAGERGHLQCAACHNAKFANAKLQKPMDVFHARCKTCHTAGVNGKKGPTACTACHKGAAAPEQKAAPAPAAAPDQAVTTAPATAPAPAAAPAPVKKKGKAVEGC
jgi:hypothetical protein